VRLLWTILCASLIALDVPSNGPAQERDQPHSNFAGAWERLREGDKGLPRIEITDRGRDGWTIQAWGDCKPKDCDWGKVPLRLLGDSVRARGFHYGFATWDAGFKDNYMIIRIEKELLIAEVYSIYKDRSGRSDYRRVCKFKRSVASS
jgi:hypothetical protein